MNTKTRNRFFMAIAALSLIGAAVHAQDNPVVETPRPAAPATPPAAERPSVEVEAPDTDAANRSANDAADAGDDAADSAEEAPIVWTRDRGRSGGARSGRGFDRNGDELVSFGGNSSLESGQRIDEVVSIFGSSTSSGEVRNAVVSVFGDTRVEGGSVGDAAVSVFGNNYVNAPVHGDVVGVMGNVELGPKADVRGEVVIVGGTLTRDPAASVRGGIQQVMGLPAAALTGVRAWLEECARYLRPLAFAPGLGWAWTIALGFLGLYALLGLVFREPVDRCVKTLQEFPGQTIVASLLTVLLTPVLFTVLAFTIIGIPFIPIASFGLFLASLFGKVVVLAWIGRALLKLIDSDDKINAALAVLAGGAVVLLLYVVPVLGFLVYNVLGILALGVVVYTLLQQFKARKRNSPPPAFGAKPQPGGPFAGTPGGTITPPGSTYAHGAAPAGPSVSAFGMPGGAPASGSAFTAGESPGVFTPGAGPSAERSAGLGDPGVGPNAGPGVGAGDAPGVGAMGSASIDPSVGPEGISSGPGFSGSGGGVNGGAGSGYGAGIPPQPPSIDALSAPRAGFWIRMAALAIDVIIIGVALSILSDSHRMQLVALAAYGAIMWKVKGTTVGGIVCNLKVLRVDGREIDWSTAIVRALGCFLSLVIVGLGFIWIAFDEGKQSWHDKIAGTAVVRVPQGVSLL